MSFSILGKRNDRIIRLRTYTFEIQSKLKDANPPWDSAPHRGSPVISNHLHNGNKVSVMRALGLVAQELETLDDKSDASKLLKSLAAIHAMLTPALAEAERTIAYSVLNSEIVKLLDEGTQKIKDSLFDCFEELRRMHSSGAVVPVLVKNNEGIYFISREPSTGIEEQQKEPNEKTPEPPEDDTLDLELEQLASKLEIIKFNGEYVSGLNDTIREMIKTIGTLDSSSLSIKEREDLISRAHLWLDAEQYGSILNNAIGEAIETMKPVEVDTPSDVAIIALIAHSIRNADFPLRYDPVHHRLCPG